MHKTSSSILLVSFFLLFSSFLQASSANIKYGGIWLKGTAAEASKRFPIGYQFFNQTNGNSAQASAQLLQLMKKKQKPKGTRLLDQIAPDDYSPSASSGQALIMALAVNYEHYETQRIANISKIFAEIGFDLVLCDMSDRSIVFTLPGRLQFVDAGSGKKKGQQMLRQLYSKQLLPYFIKLAQYKWNGNLAFSTVGLSKLNVYDQASQRFPTWMKQQPETYYSQIIASSFYETAGIPLLPYSNGEEVLYAMLREELSDSSSSKAKQIQEQATSGQGFVLRKPDYTIEVTIPCFRELIAERTELGAVAQHCAYSRVILKNTAGNEIYNKKQDGNVTSILPQGSKLQPLWLSSSEATIKMFRSTAAKLKNSKSTAVKRMLREVKP